MSSLDGQNLFASGPHTLRPAAWERSLDRRGFAGVDGELVLDMGLRSRPLIQTGRLRADTAASLRTLMSQIDAVVDGQTHMLIDDHGETYSRVIAEKFDPSTPVARGRGFWCDYTLHYRQLP